MGMFLLVSVVVLLALDFLDDDPVVFHCGYDDLMPLRFWTCVTYKHYSMLFKELFNIRN